jgi:UDP-glucose 4-epimerase
VDRLLALGRTVRVLDDLSTGRLENLRAVEGRIQFIRGCVTNLAAVRDAVRGCDCVFHVAALPSVPRSVADPLSTHAACATGTLTVLEAARLSGVRRVVYAASSSAYGEGPGAARTENDPTRPLSPYAAAKLAGENYCQAYTATYGLETVRLRLFNVFGPRQRADSPYAGVIPLFVSLFSSGRVPTVFGDGLQSRDFTYVDNAVQALVKAAAVPGISGNVYNVGTGGAVTVMDLVEQLNALLGTRVVPTHGPPRPGEVRHSRADLSRAKHDLGYEPLVTFAEGLRRTVASHRDTPAR